MLARMDIIGLVVAAIAALAAVVGAVVAIYQAAQARTDRQDAEAARDASRAARDEAMRLAGEANEAFKRQADAQERANEIEEAKLPKHAISFKITHVQGDTWAIACTDLPANDVVIKEPGYHRIGSCRSRQRPVASRRTTPFASCSRRRPWTVKHTPRRGFASNSSIQAPANQAHLNLTSPRNG